jgi:hypothetical protein
MGDHPADAAPLQDVSLGTQHGEIRGFNPCGVIGAGLHVEGAEGERAGLADARRTARARVSHDELVELGSYLYAVHCALMRAT